jgi:hypothetical protein
VTPAPRVPWFASISKSYMNANCEEYNRVSSLARTVMADLQARWTRLESEITVPYTWMVVVGRGLFSY